MDEGVDIYWGGADMKGLVIGYTEPGDWVEYTVDFKHKGPYTIKAVVSSANDNSSFKLYVDDIAITGEMMVPKTGEDSWDTYQEIGGKVDSVSTGKHILKVESVGGWFNLDYIVFENIAPPEGIAKNVKMAPNTSGEFEVIDIHGARLGRVNAKSTENAIETIKASKMVKSSGIYFIRSKATGKIQSLRIAK